MKIALLIRKVNPLAALLLTMSIIAAGCSGSENAPDPTLLLDTRDLREVNCFACHGGIHEQWQAGHGNADFNPDYAPLIGDPACLGCHDPYDLGRSPLPAFGDSRPMVHCMACHGDGEFHPGSSLIPDSALCGSCHDGSVPLDHASFQRNRFQGIYERYITSAHAKSSTFSDPACAACHTDLGFRLYGGELKYGEDGSTRTPGRREWQARFVDRSELAEPGVIGCRTCHDPHDGGLRARASYINDDPAQGVLYSRTFNLCTGCHQVYLQREGFDYRLDPEFYTPEDGESVSELFDRLEFHADRLDRVIADTHFAGYFPVVKADNIVMKEVAGHGVNAASERACLECHNPHRP